MLSSNLHKNKILNNFQLQTDNSKETNLLEIPNKINSWLELYSFTNKNLKHSQKKILFESRQESLKESMDHLHKSYNHKRFIGVYKICSLQSELNYSTKTWEMPIDSFSKSVLTPNSNSGVNKRLMNYSNFSHNIRQNIVSFPIINTIPYEKSILDFHYSNAAFSNFYRSCFEKKENMHEQRINNWTLESYLPEKSEENKMKNFKTESLKKDLDIENTDTSFTNFTNKKINSKKNVKKEKIKTKRIKKEKELKKEIKKDSKKIVSKRILKRKRLVKSEEQSLKEKKNLEKIRRRENYAFLDIHNLNKNSKFYKEISEYFCFPLEKLVDFQDEIDKEANKRSDKEIYTDLGNLNKNKTFNSYLNKNNIKIDFRKEYHDHKHVEIESDREKEKIRFVGLIRKLLHDKLDIICSVDETNYLLTKFRGLKMLKKNIKFKKEKIIDAVLEKRNI